MFAIKPRIRTADGTPRVRGYCTGEEFFSERDHGKDDERRKDFLVLKDLA